MSWLIAGWRDGQIGKRAYEWMVDGQMHVAGRKGRREAERKVGARV